MTSGISNPADGYNHLFAHVISDVTVIGLVFGLGAAWLLWKYRARDPEAVGSGPSLSTPAGAGPAGSDQVVGQESGGGRAGPDFP